MGAMVEEKMARMKIEIMQEIGVKMEENSKEVKDTFASILDLVRGLAGNRTKIKNLIRFCFWSAFRHLLIL